MITNYDEKTKDFIQQILNKIEVQCNKCDKDILDLYPPTIQFCVILLRINPNHHLAKSKKYTLDSVRNIFITNHNYALILLSHFPEWFD